MELTEDFLSIQGILINLEKSPKELSKIKYRGGKEKTIDALIKGLKMFLSTKNYAKNGQINDCFGKELKQIVLFLVINTELNQDLNISEFQHLTNITPQLSKCLLANIVIELDLSRFYCTVLNDYFPMDFCIELMVEIIPCLEKCNAITYLSSVYDFLKLIIAKLDSFGDEKKANESVEKITKQGSAMLTYIVGLNSNQSIDWDKTRIYTHMGYRALKVLDLLLLCNYNNLSLNEIIEKLLGTCCSILQAVTLDVYCTWAEVSELDDNLQTLISNKSYLVIEKYQKYAPAKELIEMLGFIARKPKTLNELIKQANLATIIAMVNKADENQTRWFSAMLNTNQILRDSDALKCVDKWSSLCTEKNVRHLLNLSVDTFNLDAKKVVAKCAASLNFPDLVLAATRYFHQNGMANVLNNDIQTQLTLVYNKILSKSSSNVDFSQELILLMLQNPTVVLSFIFGECLKNVVFSERLSDFFPHIKYMTSAQNFNVVILKQEISKNEPNDQNFNNYIAFFKIIVKTNFFSCNAFCNFFSSLLTKASEENNLEQVKYCLGILNATFQDFEITASPETEKLFNFLFELMEKYRCNFLEFNKQQMEIVKEVVNFLNNDSYFNGNIKSSEDQFVLFYQKKLLETDSSDSLLKFLYSDLNMENYSEIISHLLKILPKCTIQEWSEIAKDLSEVAGNEKLIEILTDVIILLCHLVKNQETNTDNVTLLMIALKYSLQNYGTVLKESHSCFTLEEDRHLTKNICRLLRYLPKQIESEEGVLLSQILSDGSLKSLINDKSFAATLMAIEDENIKKMLAKKVLS